MKIESSVILHGYNFKFLVKSNIFAYLLRFKHIKLQDGYKKRSLKSQLSKV